LAVREVYLDHNSTTLSDPEVVRAMTAAWQAGYANPASQHGPGRRARQALAEARERIARSLHASLGPGGDRLVLTSGGTEANNLAIFGLCGQPPASLVFSSLEHPSVARCGDALRARGFEVRRWPVSETGVAQIEQLPRLLDRSTRLVCLMLANNETGVIQPVQQAAEICRRAGTWLHTDAVQAAGKIPVNFRELNVASLALAAHKFNGPRGIGGLLIRGDVPLASHMFGGGQQLSLRPGTEDVALAVGMAVALERWDADGEARRESMRALQIRLESSLTESIEHVIVIGRDSPRLPQTSQIAFPGANRQAIFLAADVQGLAISTGSACASGSSDPSPTLLAMGLPSDVVESSVRLSWGFQTSASELDFAAERIAKIVRNLREKRGSFALSRPSR
jgi:cysteine desulfurase